MQQVTVSQPGSGRSVSAVLFIVMISGAANLQVTLAPTSTGTDVVLLIEPAGTDRLPDHLELKFTPVDQGINDDGEPFTNAILEYGNARDSAGQGLSIIDPVTIKDVETDGERASLSFTVVSIDGRRAIYPLPYSSAVRFNKISVEGDATASCLRSSGAENGRLHYFTCTIDPSGRLRYSGGPWAPESIRLEPAG
jgi:hypothetical protein